MEITNIFINIGISVVSGAAGCGLFVWLGKKWVGNWFAKDLKKYEQQLEIIKAKDEIRFSTLHKERLEAIKKLYLMINDLNTTASYLIIPTKLAQDSNIDQQEIIKQIKIKHHIIGQYLTENQIYLPQSLVDRIAGMGYSLSTVADYCLNKNDDESKEKLKGINEEKLRPLLNALRDEFRKLLGVEKEA